MYVQINFGRNIAGTPMPVETWDAFTADILLSVANYASDMSGNHPGSYIGLAEFHDGRGTWEGVTEESRHLSLFWEDNTPADKRDFASDLRAGERLRKDLRTVADRYMQDSVALIVGSELI